VCHRGKTLASFGQSLMVPVGVSKLNYLGLIFINPGVKNQ